MMSFFFLLMVTSPFAGPLVYHNEFARLNHTGRMVYYAGVVVCFGGLGLYALWFYRRFVKTHSPKNENQKAETPLRKENGSR